MIQTKLDDKLKDMTGKIWPLHEGQTLINKNIQILIDKIEAMAGNIAQPNTNEETPRMATKTPYVDATTLPSPKILNEYCRRESLYQHIESKGTQKPTPPKSKKTPSLYTQINTREDNVIDANDNFTISPQEFDTIM